MRRFLSSPTAVVGTLLLLLVCGAAIFGHCIAPYDPQQYHALIRLQGPSAAHWLGTDQFGRDLLSRVLNGAPATISFGLFSTAIGVGVGSIIGVIAGVA